jgi:glutamine amidotransferase
MTLKVFIRVTTIRRDLSYCFATAGDADEAEAYPQERYGFSRVETIMCRWLSYSGAPIFLEKLIFEPEFSLIAQSLRARKAAVATNGDGFGVGWYGERRSPACTATSCRPGPIPI